MLDLIFGGADVGFDFGGAALQRCGKYIILNPALAAEVAVCCPGMSSSAASLAADVPRVNNIVPQPV